MNNITFPEMVAALVKPGQEIIDSLTPEKVHIWHMASALLGELPELLDAISTENNILEELGDVEFYLEGYRLPFHWEILPDESKLIISSKGCAFDYFHEKAGELFDLTKKHVLYGKELDAEVMHAAWSKCHHMLKRLYKTLSINREEAIAANIEKLSKRYRGFTYSDQAAKDRADKQ
jgi:hypothetical protein